MLKKWSQNIFAALCWLLVCGLALIVLAVAANLFQVFLVVTLQVSPWSIRFWVQLFYVFGGMLWLGFFIFMEHLMFNPASRAGLLLPRTLYICGLEILVIGLLQLGMAAYGSFSWILLLLAAAELAVGGGLVWFTRRKPPARLNG